MKTIQGHWFIIHKQLMMSTKPEKIIVQRRKVLSRYESLKNQNHNC